MTQYPDVFGGARKAAKAEAEQNKMKAALEAQKTEAERAAKLELPKTEDGYRVGENLYSTPRKAAAAWLRKNCSSILRRSLADLNGTWQLDADMIVEQHQAITRLFVWLIDEESKQEKTK